MHTNPNLFSDSHPTKNSDTSIRIRDTFFKKGQHLDGAAEATTNRVKKLYLYILKLQGRLADCLAEALREICHYALTNKICNPFFCSRLGKTKTYKNEV
jgi:hypothetical protein